MDLRDLMAIEIDRSSVAPMLKTQSAIPSYDTNDNDDTITDGALLRSLGQGCFGGSL